MRFVISFFQFYLVLTFSFTSLAMIGGAPLEEAYVVHRMALALEVKKLRGQLTRWID